MAPPVRMITNEGDVKLVEADQVDLKLRAGWDLETEVQGIARSAAESEAEAYSGAADTLKAGVAGVARSLSGGLSDAALAAAGHGREVRKLREYRPGVSVASEIVGGVGGALLGIGAPGLAANASARIAGTAASAGRLAQVAAAGAGGALEGSVMGLGEGVSELALSEAPIDVERAVSTLSSKALYGGGIGAAAGTVGKALEIGFSKGRAALDDVARNVEARANVGDEFASMDKAGLRAAEGNEIERLAQEQLTDRATRVKQISAYQDRVQEVNPWAAITEGEPASLLNQSKKSLRKLMNNPVGLAENPRRALDSLRVQAESFERALSEADVIGAKLANANKRIAKDIGEELATLPDHLDEVVLSGKAARRYSAFADVKVPKEGTVTLNRGEAQTFLNALESGEVTGQGQRALKELPSLLSENRALQDQIKASMIPKAELQSPTLEKIRAARDMLDSDGGPKSLGEKMASGAAYSMASGAVAALPIPGSAFLAPFAGGAAADLISNKVFGRLGKAMSEGAVRNKAAIDKLFAVGERAVKLAPPLATRTLGAVAFAPSRDEKSLPVPGKPEKLPDLFKKRSLELREQMEAGPDGMPRMRMAARQKIADTLKPIAAMQPILADRMETVAVRRLEFLASKLPRRPEIGGIPIGPDTWQPSDMEMRRWARYVAAVEDPHGITERVASGQISPEDAEVMREVYPEMLNEIIGDVLGRLPELRSFMPYQRRLALSMLTGVPVDPSLEPRILQTLQSRFIAEPEPPKAQAQFGSVRSTNEVGTLSERRERGAS